MLGPSHPAYGHEAAETGSDALSAQVDILSSRVVSTNGSTPTHAEVTLPALPEVKRWVTRTRQDRAALQARADRIRAAWEPIRKQLADIHQSIKVLDHFLGQVAIAGDEAKAPDAGKTGPRGLPLAEGQWSRKFAACQGCGTTERKHKALGYCARCLDTPSNRVLQQPGTPEGDTP
jgi:hypothetical protein